MSIVSKDIKGYVDLLPIQYHESLKLQDFLNIFLCQVQELEDSNIGLSGTNDVMTAIGYQLDIIGKLVGAYREGRDDEEYREYILLTIIKNSGQGTPESVIQYTSVVTDADRVRYWEHYKASVILEVVSEEIQDNIIDLVSPTTPAGVKLGGVLYSRTGLVFKGCELSEAYGNLYINPNANINLCGEPLMEAGEVNAACGAYEVPDLFLDLPLEDSLSRSILPELYDAYPDKRLCGEPLMEAGEPEAYCGNVYEESEYSMGVFAEVYQ